MSFNQHQISFIKQLISNRNKEIRHEVSDHLDNSLPIKKIQGLGGATPADGSVPTYDSTQTGGVAWNKPLAARVYNNTNGVVATVTAGSWVTIPFNAEEFDNNSIHDNVTNNSRLTLNRVGVWEVGAVVLWLASAGYTGGTDLYGAFFKNGVEEARVPSQNIASGGTNVQPMTGGTALIEATAVTDYVTFAVLSDVTGTQIVGTGSKVFNNFWCRYVGPAT